MESVKTETLKSKVEAYFTECDATAERVTLKNGNVTVRQQRQAGGIPPL